MFSNWLTFRAVAESLNRKLHRARFIEIFSQEKNEAVFRLERESTPGVSSEGRDELSVEFFLQCSVDHHLPHLFLRSSFTRARKNSIDLFPDLIGQQIDSMAIATTDRIIRIRISNGCTLCFTLFSSRANVHLFDTNGALLDVFKHKTPAPNFDLAFDNQRPSLLLDEVSQVLHSATGRSVHQALKQIRPWLQGTLALEIASRASLSLDQELTQGAVTNVIGAVESVFADLNANRSFVYFENDTAELFSLVSLRQNRLTEKPYSDIHEALFTFIRHRLLSRNIISRKETIMRAVTKEHDRIERALSQMDSPQALDRRADECEKFGNLLMIHMHDMPEQPGRMTVPDIFIDPRLVVSIPLHETESVLENAQRYFQKARTLRASKDYVIERKAKLERRLSALNALREELLPCDDEKALKSILKQHDALLPSLGLTAKGMKDESPFPFRRFTVVGGYEVWAGKSSASNDELTVRHARPHDYWFHARGVGGSHVILRVQKGEDNPPKEAIRAAASVAAYYSKHRNAKSVPVAYTQKKYVRKPKGVPAGTVYLEREKVIMVEPKLPDDASED